MESGKKSRPGKLPAKEIPGNPYGTTTGHCGDAGAVDGECCLFNPHIKEIERGNLSGDPVEQSHPVTNPFQESGSLQS